MGPKAQTGEAMKGRDGVVLVFALVFGVTASRGVVAGPGQGIPGGASPSWAQGSSGPLAERYFRLEWEAGQSRRGRPLIRGYLYNDQPVNVNNVRLLIETLDASGQVTSRTVGYVDGLIPATSRTYFEVPVSAPGGTFRVSVMSFDLIRTGGGA